MPKNVLNLFYFPLCVYMLVVNGAGGGLLVFTMSTNWMVYSETKHHGLLNRMHFWKGDTCLKGKLHLNNIYIYSLCVLYLNFVKALYLLLQYGFYIVSASGRLSLSYVSPHQQFIRVRPYFFYFFLHFLIPARYQMSCAQSKVRRDIA